MTRIVDHVPTSLEAKRAEQHRASTARIARLATQPATNPHAYTHLDPAGRRALRGIPVAGATVGTIPGTNPLTAALNRSKPM